MSATRAIAITVAVLLLASQAGATWSHDPDENTLVCDAPNARHAPVITPDGEGGAFIVWEDARGPYVYDLYAQHIDARGLPLWPFEGAPVCTAVNSQFNAEVVPDGVGGVIVAWVDAGVPEIDIYAQHLDASGSQTWTSGGVLVCDTAGEQAMPKLLSDGEEGAFVVWVDYSGSDYDLYAQRLNALGDTLWGGSGVAVCTENEDQFQHELVPDGQSGFIVTWQDERSNAGDIYAQRFDADGLRAALRR